LQGEIRYIIHLAQLQKLKTKLLTLSKLLAFLKQLPSNFTQTLTPITVDVPSVPHQVTTYIHKQAGSLVVRGPELLDYLEVPLLFNVTLHQVCISYQMPGFEL
jgi:hypothetical protein